MKLAGSRKLTWIICGIGILLAIVGVLFLLKVFLYILQMEYQMILGIK